MEETQKLLAEHNAFKEKAKETRERVKLLLQLADTLVQTGHAHAPSIKSWVDEVDATYKDFSTRMDQYRFKLEDRLGISTRKPSVPSSQQQVWPLTRFFAFYQPRSGMVNQKCRSKKRGERRL